MADTFYMRLVRRNRELGAAALAKLKPKQCEKCETKEPHRYWNQLGVWICADCDAPIDVYKSPDAWVKFKTDVQKVVNDNRNRKRKNV